MRACWKEVQLGDACDVLDKYRKPITKRNREPGPYPYYGATGVLDYVADYLFDEPLVLIGEDGAKWDAGELTAFPVDGKVWVNNHAHVVRPVRKFLNDSWLIYYLNGMDLSPFITGLTVPKLNQGKLKEIPIPVPPVEEQKRIVAILDEAFAGIETAIANTEKNLANARELFENYLDSVFRGSEKEWKSTTLGELYEIGSGKRVHKEDWRESGVPFYRAREIVKLAQHGMVDNDLFISEDLFAEFSSKTGAPQPGDLMVTAVGTLGICYVVQPSDRFYFKDASVLWFRPKRPVDEQFIKYAFRSPVVKRQTTDSQGATVGTLTISRAKSISISIPSLEVQSEIASSLNAMEAEVLELQSLFKTKSASLRELKQSLLKKAFSDELTADRAEREVESATG